MKQLIHDPIDALNRVKLLMGYETSKTSKENNLKTEQTDPKAQLYMFFQACKGTLPNTRIRRIINNNVKEISNQLYRAFYRTFLGSGLGTNETKVLDSFNKLKSPEEFCGLYDQFVATSGYDLYTSLSKEVNQYIILQINTILVNLFKKSSSGQTNRTSSSCVENMLIRYYPNLTVEKLRDIINSGREITIYPRNADQKLMGGIKIMSTTPTLEKPSNWSTIDGKIQGATSCATNGCVLFNVKGQSGVVYSIDQCFNPQRNTSGGSGGRNRTQIPNQGNQQSFNWKDCTNQGFYSIGCKDTSSDSLLIKMQKCIGVDAQHHGYYGQKTLDALKTYYPNQLGENGAITRTVITNVILPNCRTNPAAPNQSIEAPIAPINVSSTQGRTNSTNTASGIDVS